MQVSCFSAHGTNRENRNIRCYFIFHFFHNFIFYLLLIVFLHVTSPVIIMNALLNEEPESHKTTADFTSHSLELDTPIALSYYESQIVFIFIFAYL